MLIYVIPKVTSMRQKTVLCAAQNTKGFPLLCTGYLIDRVERNPLYFLHAPKSLLIIRRLCITCNNCHSHMFLAGILLFLIRFPIKTYGNDRSCKLCKASYKLTSKYWTLNKLSLSVQTFLTENPESFARILNSSRVYL